MLNLIRCEFWKLKRLKLIQITLVMALLFPIILTIYVFYKRSSFALLYRFVFLYGDLLFKPCILGILCVLLLSMEQRNDTFKNLRAIPITRAQLFHTKMVLLLCLSVLYSLIEFLATALGGLLLERQHGALAVYIYCSLMTGIMLFFDILPLVLFFCLCRASSFFAVILSLFYAIAGFLLVNSYASGMVASDGVIANLPRIVIFRWFLYVFDLERTAVSSGLSALPTVSAGLFLFCTGGAALLISAVLYHQKGDKDEWHDML